MLDLLNSNVKTVELYLHPLEKYFIKTCIKLEEQIKHRKAAWLIGVRDFILTKEFYERDAETFIEFRKTYTDRKGNLLINIGFIGRLTDSSTTQYKLNIDGIISRISIK